LKNQYVTLPLTGSLLAHISEQDNKGSFIPATPKAGAIVVHIADSMARWSNDILHSTMHRVVPVLAGGAVPERYSMVFVRLHIIRLSFKYADLLWQYTKPNMDAVLDALPGTANKDRQRKYPAISVKDFLTECFKKYYPEGGRREGM